MKNKAQVWGVVRILMIAIGIFLIITGFKMESKIDENAFCRAKLKNISNINFSNVKFTMEKGNYLCVGEYSNFTPKIIDGLMEYNPKIQIKKFKLIEGEDINHLKKDNYGEYVGFCGFLLFFLAFIIEIN